MLEGISKRKDSPCRSGRGIELSSGYRRATVDHVAQQSTRTCGRRVFFSGFVLSSGSEGAVSRPHAAQARLADRKGLFISAPVNRLLQEEDMRLEEHFESRWMLQRNERVSWRLRSGIT